MNKYTKSLNEFNEFIIHNNLDYLKSKDKIEAHKTLKELVEKSEVKPPLEKTNDYCTQYFCPNCGLLVGSSGNYCKWCGQHIRGNDEEEKI